MSIQREYTRLICKRATTTTTEPTVPSTSEIDAGWVATDIYEGELFINTKDDRIWMRTQNGIVEIGTSGSIGTTLSTVDATPTDLLTINIPDGYTAIVLAVVTAIKDDETRGLSRRISATYRATGGTLTQVGTTFDTHTEFATATTGLNTSGNNLNISVTGEVATNINWSGNYQISFAKV